MVAIRFVNYEFEIVNVKFEFFTTLNSVVCLKLELNQNAWRHNDKISLLHYQSFKTL